MKSIRWSASVLWSEHSVRYGVRWGIFLGWIYAALFSVPILLSGFEVQGIILSIFVLMAIAGLLGANGGLLSGCLFSRVLLKIVPVLGGQSWMPGAFLGGVVWIAVSLMKEFIIPDDTISEIIALYTLLYYVFLYIPSLIYAIAAPLLTRSWYRRYLIEDHLAKRS